MSERPILFSGPMVRAILDGRKTQTRRVIKPRGRFSLFDGTWTDGYVLDPGNAAWRDEAHPWRAGDRLWVRETWAQPALMDVQYRADPPTRQGHWNGEAGPWRPSIFMPRWASRITLEVAGVKVERLQDISEADARAEGANPVHMQPGGPEGNPGDGWVSYVDGFRRLWNSINGPDSWDENPWVAAISFNRVTP